MGGSIGFGIRWKDDKGIHEVYMDRWTNDLFWRIMSPDFINQGKEMQALIDEAKPNHKWPSAVQLEQIERGEYGVVLVDFPSRSIYSRNDYSTPGSNYLMPHSSAFSEELVNAEQMAKDGKLLGITVNVLGIVGKPKVITPKAFLKECEKLHKRSKAFYQKVKDKKIVFKDEWEELDAQRSILGKFFNQSMQLHLSPDVFQIDAKTNRHPPRAEVLKWCQDHGWTMPVAEKDWEREE